MGRTKADSAASTVPAGFPREPLPPLLCLATMHPGAAAKNPPVKAGDAGDAGSIRGWGRSPGGGNGNPLWYSCLENPMDRGAWQATVRGVAKSQTRLSPAHTHTPPQHISQTSTPPAPWTRGSCLPVCSQNSYFGHFQPFGTKPPQWVYPGNHPEVEGSLCVFPGSKGDLRQGHCFLQTCTRKRRHCW